MFGRDFAADARRRDFTINALSLDLEGTVHDYVGGLDDLAAGRVRFIGDAESAHPRGLSAHPSLLPLLRPVRRRRLDPEGLSAAIGEREGLARLSRERVRAELMKLLVAPRPSDVVQRWATAAFSSGSSAASPTRDA